MQRLDAGHVVRAVDDDQRVPTEDLKAAGDRDRREAELDDVLVQWGAEERLDCRQSGHGVNSLVGAVEGHQDLGIEAFGGAQIDQASAHRQAVGGAVELLAQDPHLSCTHLVGSGAHDLDKLGIVGADDDTTRRFDDAGLVPRNALEARPEDLGVVEAPRW